MFVPVLAIDYPDSSFLILKSETKNLPNLHLTHLIFDFLHYDKFNSNHDSRTDSTLKQFGNGKTEIQQQNQILFLHGDN